MSILHRDLFSLGIGWWFFGVLVEGEVKKRANYSRQLALKYVECLRNYSRI